MGNEQAQPAPLTETEKTIRNIKSMDKQMSRKFGEGVQYSMRIVIRGASNTGKTNLFRRLQRLTFEERYLPTPRIEVAHIDWSYKVRNFGVDVEIWDVVDRARQPGAPPEDRISMLEEEDEDADTPKLDLADVAAALANPSNVKSGSTIVQSALDARVVDVYRNTHGVIFCFDPIKPWTWEYVKREVPKVPKDIYILLVANFCDLSRHRRISEAEVKQTAKEWEDEGKHVVALETSMLNGYGRDGVEKFLNLPFLDQQRRYLINQLSENREEFATAVTELKAIAEEQNYAYFLKALQEARRARKDQSTVSSRPTPQHPLTSSGSSGTLVSPASPVASPTATPVRRTPSTADIPPGPNNRAAAATPNARAPPPPARATTGPIQSVDDFAPDEGDANLKQFLGSSDDDSPNALLDPEIDPEDEVPTASKPAAAKQTPARKAETQKAAEERQRREEEEARKRKKEAEEREKQRMKREALEQQRREAEEKLKREAEERTKRETTERQKREAEERQKREAEEKQKREAEERLKREAAERQKKEAEQKHKRAAKNTWTSSSDDDRPSDLIERDISPSDDELAPAPPKKATATIKSPQSPTPATVIPAKTPISVSTSISTSPSVSPSPSPSTSTSPSTPTPTSTSTSTSTAPSISPLSPEKESDLDEPDFSPSDEDEDDLAPVSTKPVSSTAATSPVSQPAPTISSVPSSSSSSKGFDSLEEPEIEVGAGDFSDSDPEPTFEQPDEPVREQKPPQPTTKASKPSFGSLSSDDDDGPAGNQLLEEEEDSPDVAPKSPATSKTAYRPLFLRSNAGAAAAPAPATTSLVPKLGGPKPVAAAAPAPAVAAPILDIAAQALEEARRMRAAAASQSVAPSPPPEAAASDRPKARARKSKAKAKPAREYSGFGSSSSDSDGPQPYIAGNDDPEMEGKSDSRSARPKKGTRRVVRKVVKKTKPAQ